MEHGEDGVVFSSCGLKEEGVEREWSTEMMSCHSLSPSLSFLSLSGVERMPVTSKWKGCLCFC